MNCADSQETARVGIRWLFDRMLLGWAFSTSNVGAYYNGFFKRLDQLDEINWAAVAAQAFRNAIIKEGKQAEFLLFDDCPWQLIEWIGASIHEQRNKSLRFLGRPGIAPV